MKKRNLFIALGIIVLAVILYFSDVEKFLKTSLISSNTNVVLETNLGNITIKLLPDEAPEIVKNFAQLVDSDKYDSTIFHRVIDGFMIQGGDYENRNGTGGKTFNGKELADEFSPNLSHVRGTVSMANRGPNTNGSQFFIVQQDASFLDGRHSIFGQVVEGMDVVDRIAKVNTDAKDMPLENVTIFDAYLSN